MKSLFDENAKLREQSPVHIVDGPGGLRYGIYGFDEVSAALKDRRFGAPQLPGRVLRLLRLVGLSALANAAEFGFFASLNAPDHTRVRKVMDPTFSPRAVKAREPQIRATVTEFLDRLEGRDTFDLVADFAAPLPAWIIADVFGFPPEERDAVRRWTDDLLPIVDAETRRNALVRSVMAFFRFRRRVLAIVRKRKDDPRDDLLSSLSEAYLKTRTITRDELVGSAALALTAGHVTTRHLLTNCVRLLLQNPDALARALSDDAALETVIEETTRLLSPIQTTGRVTTEEVDVAGHKIPKGAKIRLFLGSANHDARRFERPREIDVDQRVRRHLGYGGGIHFCLGIHLARVEVRIAIKELFRRFPNLAAIEEDVTWGRSTKFLGVERFPVHAGAPASDAATS
ncbi:MAG: cytochrome P450 [Pseudomonadota bacterium]